MGLIFSRCDLFDFINLCLAPVQSPELIVEIRQMARKVAGHVHKYFPESERSLVLHMLVFHAPDAIALWGPARGWWVFAFERSVTARIFHNLWLMWLSLTYFHNLFSRMMGHFVRNVKSRRYAEKNLVNRVMFECTLERQYTADRHQREKRDDSESETEEDAAFVVAPSMTNSTTPPGQVRWAAFTRDNSATLFPRRGVADPDLIAEITKYIGAKRVQQLGIDRRIIRSDARMIGTDSTKVWIGVWRYATITRENRNLALQTTQAYFAIQAAHVPFFVDQCEKRKRIDPNFNVAAAVDKAGQLYGQFVRFYKFYLDAQHTFEVAQVRIFRAQSVHPITKLPTINMDIPISLDNDKELYIELKHVICPIALGPVVTGWDKNDEEQLVTDDNEFVVMHCRK